jgi:alpha-tubulin suppressor-like RCC1 family protein
VSQKYPGGIISKTAPVTVGPVDGEGGSAPGIWTLTQALELQKQNLWPKPVLPRELWSWGGNEHGQVGDGFGGVYGQPDPNRSSPVQVGALTDWVEASSGQYFSVAIRSTGTMWSWGQNTGGKLGLDLHPTYGKRSSPVQIGSLSVWSKVSAQRAGACAAVRTTGSLWAWGSGSSGKLGLNDTYNRSSPVQVGALTNWKQPAMGGDQCFAIKTDGTLWAWGDNSQGQLGINSTSARSSPVQVGSLTNWAQVSSGAQCAAAVKTDGTLWAWGRNNNGQLGLDDTVSRSSPVQVGALTTWKQVSMSGSFCVAVRTNSTIWAWGLNNSGQLGLGDGTSRSSPTQIGALTDWAYASAGNTHCMAIKTNRTLWAWGQDSSVGKLGQNNIDISRSSPVQVGALTTWLKVSASQLNNLAIKTT